MFVVGFGSSMFFGTFIGSLADRLGRKRFCLLYIVLYILSCVTKYVGNHIQITIYIYYIYIYYYSLHNILYCPTPPPPILFDFHYFFFFDCFDKHDMYSYLYPRKLNHPTLYDPIVSFLICKHGPSLPSHKQINNNMKNLTGISKYFQCYSWEDFWVVWLLLCFSQSLMLGWYLNTIKEVMMANG